MRTVSRLFIIVGLLGLLGASIARQHQIKVLRSLGAQPTMDQAIMRGVMSSICSAWNCGYQIGNIDAIVRQYPFTTSVVEVTNSSAYNDCTFLAVSNLFAHVYLK